MSYAQASQDHNVHTSQLRNWVKAFAEDPPHAFPGNGQIKPEQIGIARLKREVVKLKADIQNQHRNPAFGWASVCPDSGLRRCPAEYMPESGIPITGIA